MMWLEESKTQSNTANNNLSFYEFDTSLFEQMYSIRDTGKGTEILGTGTNDTIGVD